MVFPSRISPGFRDLANIAISTAAADEAERERKTPTRECCTALLALTLARSGHVVSREVLHEEGNERSGPGKERTRKTEGDHEVEIDFVLASGEGSGWSCMQCRVSTLALSSFRITLRTRTRTRSAVLLRSPLLLLLPTQHNYSTMPGRSTTPRFSTVPLMEDPPLIGTSPSLLPVENELLTVVG